MPADMTGKVLTVLGPIGPEDLGVTLTHEHLLIDASCLFHEPEAATDRRLAHEPVRLENLWWIRYHWTSNLGNLLNNDEDLSIREALLYKREGGNAIVDAGSVGLGRDPLGLARISRATGLQVIMGGGYYVAASHPSDMDRRTEEDIAREIVRDVTEGVGDTGIRTGIIGEIGCSWPWHKNEQKVVRAAAAAQRRTGAPLMVHPGRHPDAPAAILDSVRHAGGEVGRTIICHIDRTLLTFEQQRKLAELGCYLAFDLFGIESSYYPAAPHIDMPSDAQRMEHIARLIAAGHVQQLLLSHDLGQKVRLTAYGGHGYGHLLRDVLPRMPRKGITPEHIRTMLVENPKRILQFAAPGEQPPSLQQNVVR